MSCEGCECGDAPLPAPSPGWQFCRWRPLTGADVPLLLASFREPIEKKLHRILKEIRTMGDQVTTSLAHLSDDLHKVADVIAALKADNDALRANNAALTEALAAADANKAAAVAEQAQADDNADAAAVDEADSIIHDLVNQADNPPADPSA